METTARVVAVAPESPAARAGVAPGDELLALNGEALRDVVRYQLAADEADLELEVRSGGIERTVEVRKRTGQPLGMELESAVFDRVRTCDNHCPFCFIHQLPKGMRRSLYLKDDDYRLSFLYGNFTTLTRFTEADLERIVEERLGPLYVSIHATDPEVRTRLLRNRRGATSLRWLRLLLDHGVEVHGQVVLCPGVNDGDVLDDTLLGVLDRYPELATLGVVPIGVSAHNTESEMRALTAEEAERTLETLEAWQRRFLDVLGRRLVFASDELYLLAGAEFPELASYEGLAQHENGIGMVRTFEHEVRTRLRGGEVEPVGPSDGFFAWSDGAEAYAPCGAPTGEPTGEWRRVEGAPAEGYRAERTVETPVQLGAPRTDRNGSHGRNPRDRRDRPVGVITGEYGARVLEPLLAALEEQAGVPVRPVRVPNRFFGGNIAVAGLLTGADVAAALEEEPADHRYLLPDVVLSKDRFLDGTAVTDLPVPVEVVPTTGVDLVDALAR